MRVGGSWDGVDVYEAKGRHLLLVGFRVDFGWIGVGADVCWVCRWL